ncbi:MAG TPA: glycosyltransferase 87 family protein [Streptosporangiaceae bacterium]|nr:glycosyltransferase 87 family protein [Streptosporangiaceae bacterium]
MHNDSVPSLTTFRGSGRLRLAAPRPALPERLRRAGPGVLAWAAALALVARLVLRYLTNPSDQRMVDLDVYRTGGVSLLHGQPIYHMLTQAPQLLPFTYPPIAAVFAVPLAMMSWPAAQMVWLAFIYVPLAVTIWYAFRPLLGIDPGGRPPGTPRTVGAGGRPLATPGVCAGRYAPVVYAGLFAVCAYLFPMRDEMRFGQVDILLVALCVADCAAVSPRWPRGALVGLATAVKLVPGVFIIYLWITGRRRAAATAAASAAAWTLGAFALLPRDSLYYWTNAIFDSNRLGSNTGTSNQSLRGILLRLFLPSAAPGALWLVAAIVVAATGFVVARRMARTGGEIAGVAVTGLLAVLLSPVAWIHHLAWVVVVIGAVVGDGRDRRRLAAAVAIIVFYTVTLPWWGLSLMKVGWLPKVAGRIVQSSFGLGAIALIPVVAWAHRRGVASADAAAPGGPSTAVPPGNEKKTQVRSAI